jgi:tetratricopeptide (TPR) repeat protein
MMFIKKFNNMISINKIKKNFFKLNTIKLSSSAETFERANKLDLEGNFKEAKEIYLIALEKSKKESNKLLTAMILQNLGFMSHSSLNVEKKELIEAEMYLEEGSKIANELNNEKMFLEMQLNLGKIAYNLRKYEKSKSIYEYCLNRSTELNYTLIVIHCYFGLGDLCNYDYNFSFQKEIYEKALELSLKLNDKPSILLSYSSIGYSYNKLKKYQISDNYFEKSLKLCDELNEDTEKERCLKFKDDNIQDFIHELSSIKQNLSFLIAYEENKNLFDSFINNKGKIKLLNIRI